MLIKTENLTKIYHPSEEVEVRALGGVSVEIEEGEFVSIVGPSGCGKSTLLHLIGCLDTPTGGSYRLENEEINEEADLSKIRNREIGFVFQTFNLLSRLTAEENVELPLIYGGISFQDRRQRAQEILTELGLGDRLDHRPTQLSGGQQQRVAIARALINKPKLILADEPTGNLDSKSGAEVFEILTDLNRRGTTILMVTHDHELANRTKRKIEMLDGKVVSK